MRRLSDLFAEAARECADPAQLRMLIDDVARELGFQFFALLDHASLVRPRAGLLRIDNYPDEWVEELLARDCSVDDPVHLACRRANMAFAWSELPELVPLEPSHRRILERSRDFGLGPGITIPANVPGEPSASCSFAVRAGGTLPVGRLPCAALIGSHALSAARRLRTQAKSRRPHLSRRELQCLKLVALGKTDWEIARILGLSPHTARQYVKRARVAYDAVSRTQLVVYGLRDAWIGFEDAIPPDG